jgi:hypothetical protein
VALAVAGSPIAVVAITVTVVAEAMLLGALYTPFDTDPTAGTNDQETLEL